MFFSTRVIATAALALSFLSSSVATPVPSKEVMTGEDAAALEKRITHTGVGTYFWQNGNAGACGHVNKDSTYIVATSSVLWRENGSGNCNQYVHISGRGKSAYAKVADECPECALGHLDMSHGLFNHFAPDSVGEFSITWNFMPKGFKP